MATEQSKPLRAGTSRLRFGCGLLHQVYPWLTLRVYYGLRSGDRAGDACSAQNEIENVVRLRESIRRAAKHERLSGLPRYAGRVAGGERRSAPAHRADGSAAPGHRVAARQVRPEKLLLSGRSEELPDHPIRPAVHGGRAR